MQQRQSQGKFNHIPSVILEQSKFILYFLFLKYFIFYYFDLVRFQNLYNRWIRLLLSFMIQKERSNLRPSVSLNKLSCLPIDKTFPHLINYIEANDSPHSKQKKANIALRQFDKKFYEDEIKMLLCKMQSLAEKNRALQAQVERLRQEKKRSQSIQQRTVRKAVGQIQCPETIDSISTKQKQQEGGPVSVMNRLKTNYMAQLEKIKVEYEKRLKQKSNLLKSLQYENYCKTMEMRFEEERLRKQNDQLRKQLQSKKKIQIQEKQSPNHQNEEKVEGAFQLQSYREENALLRSFIYKIQLTEQKLEKLEQSRKKQRQQFVVYAEQSQSEKRQLLKDMEDMKNVYQQKLKLLNLNFEQKLTTRDLQVKQLQSRLQAANNDRMNHIPTSLSQQNKQKKDFEDEKKDYLENSQNSHNEWQKMQKSLLRLASQKDQKMEAMWLQIKQLKQKEVLYHQEIQRLRIERNNIAVENKSLQNQLLSIKIEVTNIENQYRRTNLNEQKIIQNQYHRPTQSTVSKVEESSGIKRSASVSSMKLSQWRRVEQLQKALKQQKQSSGNALKELQMMQSYIKSKQNSMKLTQQMSQNSYKQLWQKYSQILLQNAKLKQTNEQLEKDLKILKNNVSNKQKQQEQLREEMKKEKQLKDSECEMLKDQCRTLKYQYDEVMQEVNQRAEQAQVTIYRQSKEIQRNIQEIDKLNQKITTKNEEFIKEKYYQDQEIKILKDQLNNVHERLHIQENSFAAQINQFRKRYEMTQILSLQLKSNIQNLKLQQQKVLEEKQNMIVKLQEELLKKNEIGSQKPFKKINTLFDTSCHESRVSNQSNSEIFGTVEYYQTQICQINSHHNHEVECLKQYIRELIAENDQLRQRCISSVNKWKEMFEGVISYNKFVGHQEEIMQKSLRKRDIIAGSMQSIQNKAEVIEQKLMQKYQIDSILQSSSIFKDKNNLIYEVIKIDHQVPSNSWEVYSIPDFSERKLQQTEKEIENKSIVNMNLCQQMKKSENQSDLQKVQNSQDNHNEENDPNINNCNINLVQKCVEEDCDNKIEQNQGFYNRRKSVYERFKQTR